MGEHSIIIPECRDIDRESGLRVVCNLASRTNAGRISRLEDDFCRRSCSCLEVNCCSNYCWSSSSSSSSSSSFLSFLSISSNSLTTSLQDLSTFFYSSSFEEERKIDVLSKDRETRSEITEKHEAEEGKSKAEVKFEGKENCCYFRKKRQHCDTSLARGFRVDNTDSTRVTRLFRRLFPVLLSLLGTLHITPTSFALSPPSSSLSRPSASFPSTSSRGALLFSGSWALVSIIILGLLRPTMAVPTTVTATSNNPPANAANDTNDTPLARIMRQQQYQQQQHQQQQQQQHLNAAAFEEEEEAQEAEDEEEEEQQLREEEEEGEQVLNQEEEEEEDEDKVNYESAVMATMNRRRRTLEEPSHIYDDVFPSLVPHPRESGLERAATRLRDTELDTIRRSIMEGLGLERIPDPSKANVSQTEYRRAHEEYLTRIRHSRGDRDPRLRRLHTFHPEERPTSTFVNRRERGRGARSINDKDEEDRIRRGDTVRHSSESRVLYFPMEIPDPDADVDHATLRFLMDPTDTRIDRELHDVLVYRVSSDSREFVSREATFLGNGEGPRWMEIDATEIARFWHDRSYGINDQGLELRFINVRNERVLSNKETQPRITNPALNVFATSSQYSHGNIDNDQVTNVEHGTRRKRRATPQHLMSLHRGRRTECRGESKKCCRHEMIVTFKDVQGFEFIIQPKNFDAGYCKGRCPPRYNPAHHHALLQSLIWKEDRQKAPRPCCAPSKLDELEILYFDENDSTKLKVSIWKNMKVLECACS